MNLVIVESPTKAKTISKFLGKNYEVTSSYGHVRDLPKSDLGIDVEKNFQPRYVIPTKARKRVTELKKMVGKADEVILATDEDREGEAIAWHLAQALGLSNTTQAEEQKSKTKNSKPKTLRIVFHEITKTAIADALKTPREVDIRLVDSQQARRVLDRLVGYKLSPFLWKKVLRGLSAGRVQSVAVRLIVEREREIKNFKPQEYWSLEATLEPLENSKNKTEFTAYLHAQNGKPLEKFAVKTKAEAENILTALKKSVWSVAKVEQKEVKKNPLPPFTTSTLQQAAWSRFGYSAKRTMMLAQNLYERGLITYHRTDSFNLAQSALTAGRAYIQGAYGSKYLPEKPNFYKTRSKGAQEAHEAIRPTTPEKNPEKLKLEGPQKKLYTLVWQRFLASQMQPARFSAVAADIATNTPYVFRVTGQELIFDGFLKVYPMKFEEANLPQLREKDPLTLKKLENSQHFTNPPARYNEATLVKALERAGIGRPSTYAPIISTIQERNYVEKNEQKRLAPTEIGTLVTDLLMEHFPKIVDLTFTAQMEEKLDAIAQGKEEWQTVIRNFYNPFEKNLEEKYAVVEKKNMVEETDKICPQCAKKLVKRMGRFGWFYACSGFPECKHTETLEKKTDINAHCPKCAEGKIVERRTKRKKIFYGCSRYPDCDFASWDKPHIEQIPGTKGVNRVVKCPKCNGHLVEKKNAVLCPNKECGYKAK